MSDSRPNILLVLTDQQRFDTLGCNGAPVCRTPCLDQLAAEGTRFGRAYTCCALCTPARASLLTGVFPHRHGLTRNTERLAPAARSIPPSIPTIAERLGEIGYRCTLEGKWHAGDRSPRDVGFDGLATSGYGNAMGTPEYQAHLRRFGAERPTLTPLGTGWSKNVVLAGSYDGPVEASVPHFVAQRTIDSIEASVHGQQPFLTVASFWGPHAPYLPCEPYASMYHPRLLEPWPNFVDAFTGKPAVYRRHQEAFRGKDGTLRSWEECARWAALYFGFVSQIDAQIGRILRCLEETGAAESTLVLFTTDHGDLCGAHGGLHDKTSVGVEELYHIPLVARPPRAWKKGRGPQCDAMVSLLDVPATILDAAGCRGADALDGYSLRPQLEAGLPDPRPDYVIGMDHGIHCACDMRLIVQGAYKYIHHPTDIDELYDLDADPWELHNQVANQDLAQVRERLRQQLMTWCRDHEDPAYDMLHNFYGDRAHCTLDNAQPYRTHDPY